MDENTEYTATSSMIVDLSGDNDNIGAITAANSVPKTPVDSPFERSCDNPECSAPKLISLVPKRETAEFITEPSVMNQPTLVNGFTTVFQVDGLAAKMNDIMNGNFGEAAAEGYSDQSKPKTVFRIVPNTHAHIVNYVVVDGAGETMRKIKSNDPETMQKLLDSQRLSAEQMLKKLISKAFKKNPEPPVPLPIPSKVPGYTRLGIPLQNTVNAGAGPFPSVPNGITITPVDPIQVPESPLVINISPKLPTKPNVATSSKENSAPKPTARATHLFDPSNKAIKKIPPKGIAAKDTPPKFRLPPAPTPNVVPTKAATAPKVTTVSTTPKPTPPITTPVKTMTLAVTASRTPTSATAAATKKSTTIAPALTATATASTVRTAATIQDPKTVSEPLVASTKPGSVTPARATPAVTNTKSATTPTVASARSSLTATLASQATTLASSPAPPKPVQNLQAETTRTTPNILKRKQPVDTPEAVKRLRPRSPKQRAPMAVGLQPSSQFPSPPRKLPTLPKLPTKPPTTSNPPTPAIHPPKKALPADVGSKSQMEIEPPAKPKEVPTARSLEIAKAFATCLAEPEKSISNADIPNALSTVRSLAAKVSAALAVNSGVTKIGETYITPSIKAKEDVSPTPQTKSSPTDAPSSSKNLEEASSNTPIASTTKPAPPPATSKPVAPQHTTTILTTIAKLTSTGPKIIAQTKRNLEPITLNRQSSSPETDPLALDDLDRTTMILPKPGPSATLLRSTSKESEPSNETQPLQTVSDVRGSKFQVSTPMTTRGAAPKAATPTAAVAKQDKVLSLTPTRMLRVMLPAMKSGVMTLPVRSPHPNLKISSVLSGSAVAETLKTTNPKPAQDEKSSEIDKLQQELADLRRTVQRLSRKKS